MNVEGSRVLVTGASRGIGAALAESFAARGAEVVLVGRDVAALAEVAQRVDGVARAVDLADPVQVRGLVGEIEADLGPIDVLVNNAGVESAGSFHQLDEQTAEAVYRVNLLTPVELCRQVLPGMGGRGRGHIVNVSSLAALSAFPGLAVYGSSKAGLTQFTTGLRADLRGGPIGTTLVELGPTTTDMLGRVMSYRPTADSFARLYALKLLVEVSPRSVAQTTVEAVLVGRQHVRLPRRAAIAAQLAASPRRTTQWLLTGVAHQQGR
ncbi:MAG: SDR family NAD(P)-dependent oxidoreductase [Propionibacteriales bacterium]|nr:SDR family NAD(P)-dependent oxidoreductase [Propionibacteriales bacterium]